MNKKGEMLTVGRITAAPLVRFGRNQRRAALVAPKSGSAPGVLRFSTWEEFSSWKTTRRRKG
jgi:hypothetical protein